ncbi:hypothetical protein ACUNV4_24610 [Granulosicoccus sp. 3-233]|uniref:hypothetical protein n=1 Tax=Granulosicoccus sp. 3-233 TaxID=3417969 RepID=UPI003D344580
MNPVALLAIFVALWSLTHFWIVPLLQSGWKTKNLHQKVAKIGILAACEKLRDAAGAALLSLCLVVFLIWLFDLFSGIDHSAGQSLINGLTSLHRSVSDFVENYATTAIWIGIIGSAIALYLVARHARSRVVAAWTTRAEQIFEQLSADPNRLLAYADEPELSELVERVAGLLRRLSEMGVSKELLAEREQLRAELGDLFSLTAMEIARKELDVEEVLSVNQTQQPEDQPNLLARVLSSRRLSADLELVNRPLSMLVTALLVISLIGWTSEPLADSMRLAVNNLRVHSLQADLEREVNTVVEIAEVEEDDGTDDELFDLDAAERVARVSAHVARVSLQQMMQSGILERSAGVRPARHSRTDFVRAAVLRQEIASPIGRSERLRAAASESIGPRFQEPETVLRRIERDLAPVLEALDRRDPGLLARLHQRVNQRYGIPMGALDAQGNLIARMVGQTFSAGGGSLDNELARQGADLAREIGEKAVGKWSRAYANHLVVETLLGQAHSEVAEKMRSFRFSLTPESETLVRQVASDSARGWRATAAEAVDQRIASQVAQSVADRAPVNQRAAIVRNFGGYSEIFPTVAQGISEGLGQAIGQDAPRRSSSTNFRTASRSFKVRGVLFGQDPEADDFDVRQVDWKWQGEGQVSLSIENGGSAHEIGVFDAGILNQALRYAADQRVVAVTITPGDGNLMSRLTYLHPALADTPLGCRVIEADRLVDSFTFNTEESLVDPRLRDIAEQRMAIRRWQYFAMIAEGIAAGDESYCSAAGFQNVVADGVVVPEDLAMRSREFMDTDLGEQASSVLVEKTLACAAGDPVQAGQCLCDGFQGTSLPIRYWYLEDHTSQFREKERRLDDKFEFAALSDNALDHVDLWLHTTFAARSRYDGRADESTAKALDFSVDQMKRVNGILKEEKIPEYAIETLGMSADEFMIPLGQFLVLQRFFRASFNDRLGEQFPLGRLIELEQQTRQYVEYQPTMRWEPVPGNEQQFYQALEGAGEEAVSLFDNHYSDIWNRIENNLPMCGPSSTHHGVSTLQRP